jgi:shikimate 5-dehydrogenase
MASRRGLKHLDGLGMLVSQGARSFEIFTGKRAPFRVMKNAVEHALKFNK